jgi:hypothetical protein
MGFDENRPKTLDDILNFRVVERGFSGLFIASTIPPMFYKGTTYKVWGVTRPDYTQVFGFEKISD